MKSYDRRIAVLLAGTALWAQPIAAQTTRPASPQSQSTAPTSAQAPEVEPAQGVGGSGAQADGGGLQDIVVTATKIETRLQDTPIAIRAVDGETLNKAGITDVAGLQRIAPDLNVTPDTVYTKIAIRGVSSQDISESSDPALTIAIDGEYVNRPVALNASFFDLERIEVLRGPQGTLFGRNSTAGALNIVAAKPRLGEFGGFATVGYGNYDALYATGAVNVPVGDDFAFRVAGLHTEHKGYVDNGAAGRGDNANTDAVRGSLYWTPGQLQVYLAGEYIDVNQTGPSQFGFVVTPTTPGVTSVAASTTAYPLPEQRLTPSFVDLPAGFDAASFPLAQRGSFRSEQWAVRGRVAYDFGPATISYIGGYRHGDNAAYLPLNGFVPQTFVSLTPHYDTRTQSHEVRLNGGQTGAFVWQVGGFYFKERQIIERGTFVSIPQAYANYFIRPYVNSESKAAFAQATYWIVPDVLSFTGGVRYTDDKKNALYYDFGFTRLPNGAAPTIDTPGARIRRPTYAEDKVTWTAGVEYKPARDNLLYAKVSTGYKSGGFDLVGDFQAENIKAYEIGSKNRFMNNRLEFNASAFYYDYSDQQVQVYIDTTVGARTFNAGKSRIWGIETDTSVKLSDNDRATITVNYIDAKLQQFAGVTAPVLANAPAGTPAITANLAGNRPPQAPRWTIAIGYDKTVPLGGDYKLIGSVFSRFKSDYFLTAFNYRGDSVDAFTATDLNLELVFPGDRLSIQGYMRNVENNRVKTFAGFTGGGINVYNWNFGPPRTYGAQATFKF